MRNSEFPVSDSVAISTRLSHAAGSSAAFFADRLVRSTTFGILSVTIDLHYPPKAARPSLPSLGVPALLLAAPSSSPVLR